MLELCLLRYHHSMITCNANFLNRFFCSGTSLIYYLFLKKKRGRAQLLFSQIQLQFTYFTFWIGLDLYTLWNFCTNHCDFVHPWGFLPKPRCKWLLQLFSIKPTYIGWTLGIVFFLTLHVIKHWARAVAFISLAKAGRYPPIKCSHEIVQLGMNPVFFFSFLHIYATFYHAGCIASLPMLHFLYGVLFCPCFTDIYCPWEKM